MARLDQLLQPLAYLMELAMILLLGIFGFDDMSDQRMCHAELTDAMDVCPSGTAHRLAVEKLSVHRDI